MANLINSYIRCSQGDLEATVNAVLSNKTHNTSKSILSPDGPTDIPHFTYDYAAQNSNNEPYIEIKSLVQQSIQHLNDDERKETAVIIGTSIIDNNIVDAIHYTLGEHTSVPDLSQKRSIDSFAQDLSNELDLNGYTLTINTACTSSANAILEAANLVDAKIFKYVVVIGIEFFSEMMSNGFNGMQLLSKTAVKPFDQQRDGLVLGEGVASLLIGSDQSEWEICGGYSNCSADNVTSASADGRDFANVMHKALENAKVKAGDITALKTHATGTPLNDAAEMKALSTVFKHDLLFTALKPYLGHTIGACGTLELAIFSACVDDGYIPKTLNHTDTIDKRYVPLLEHKACTRGTFMLNYFGFGGNNTSLVIRKVSA